MSLRFLPLLALAAAVPAVAQDNNSAVAGLGAVYTASKDNLIKAAEQMPEEHYGFQPMPEVRTFGKIVGHVANANYFFCSMAQGEQNPSGRNIEETVTSKDDLVKAIKDSFDYCDKAMKMADAKAMEEMTLFQRLKTNRLGVLAFNAGHNFEHYGNLVTYMRLKGLVPPSSQN